MCNELKSKGSTTEEIYLNLVNIEKQEQKEFIRNNFIFNLPEEYFPKVAKFPYSEVDLKTSLEEAKKTFIF